MTKKRSVSDMKRMRYTLMLLTNRLLVLRKRSYLFLSVCVASFIGALIISLGGITMSRFGIRLIILALYFCSLYVCVLGYYFLKSEERILNDLRNIEVFDKSRMVFTPSVREFSLLYLRSAIFILFIILSSLLSFKEVLQLIAL
jgi:hypothetical protein